MHHPLVGGVCGACIAAASLGQTVTMRSLLEEMTDRDAVARWPEPSYRTLQASSYNRESVHRDAPGWFADSDGTGFIREERVGGRTEWVIMEQDGPGCLTRLWTPYFYYDLNEHIGPSVRVYLDGSATPVIDESLIKLVRGEGSVGAPFAVATARAGDLYLPIPFEKGCRVTMTGRPFYYAINSRAYEAGTRVESFSRAGLDGLAGVLREVGGRLVGHPHTDGPERIAGRVEVGRDLEVGLPAGAGALRGLLIRAPGAVGDPSILRRLAIGMEFDGEPCVWCPLGDFFCCADSIHAFETWERSVREDGEFECRWVMPFEREARVRLVLCGGDGVEVEVGVTTDRWEWDDRSMHFHAGWRPDDVVPGTPFSDWNFVDISGRGVYVGDAWTVLNPQAHTWWGEGDEKVYVDGDWEAGFPSIFGTGTEDYYGWAGGEIPTRRDEFAVPFLANVRVGGIDGTTLGFNICTRSRSLDALPFQRRLRFDMESSFGTDIRNPWNQLGYSAVTFWYARPGATDNRGPRPEAGARPIMHLVEDARNGKRVER
ncbi:MAG: DUF2961 domain-containing protein [Phycisphaerales bacterium]|nr:DUF2961 domain-containing protein [Phycisphaerales bacterium]